MDWRSEFEIKVFKQAAIQVLTCNCRLTGFEGVRDFLSIYVPKLSEWFPNFMGYTRRLQVTHDLLDIFKQIVTEHRKTGETGVQRDLLDVYLETMAATTDPNSSFHPEKG